MRTLRRYPDGHCLVSVQSRGRPAADVLADMVEGLLIANQLHGVAAASSRARMLEMLAGAPPRAA